MSNGFEYQVSLTHVKSGDTVVFKDIWDYPSYVRDEGWEFDPVFLWSDGNYSCNCNRDLFFNRATNPEYNHEDDDARNCDDFDEYRVNWIKNLETGRVIYREPESRV